MPSSHSAGSSSWRLGPDLKTALGTLTGHWERAGLARRLWARDATVWTAASEARWLGWLDVATLGGSASELAAAQEVVAAVAPSDVLLLGMGGSSLGAEVVCQILGAPDRGATLHVLDTTDPAQVRRLVEPLDLARTVCIVSSKSGTTLETALLADYLLGLAERQGGTTAARRFLGITDPGSALERRARESQFGGVWSGRHDVGGRFSVLSNFGLVPAAVCGVDVSALVERATEMATRCGPTAALRNNPGVQLGLVLGCAAGLGRDKVTLVMSPAVSALGPWLEQLLAESTGKEGHGLLPVVDEPLASPEDYSTDRLFVSLRVVSEPDAGKDVALTTLADAGHPVVELRLPDRLAIGAEFFRWEMATAVCGAVLGVNPFDQPDVEASKVATRALMTGRDTAAAETGSMRVARLGAISLHAAPETATELRARAGVVDDLPALLSAHVQRLVPGEYFGLLAYLDMCETNRAPIQRIRYLVQVARRVATTVGFGPRFLHSTGQLFKGGPATGVFLLLTCDHADPLTIPGRNYTFDDVNAAQAQGDLAVLVARKRRVVRLHLGLDVSAALTQVETWVRAACSALPPGPHGGAF
ncbi:MAG: transaldolase [Acidobacteriota bacterium]|nr:transaldolase [Acidobacteriota bacterium]